MKTTENFIHDIRFQKQDPKPNLPNTKHDIYPFVKTNSPTELNIHAKAGS
jgi:hypothetical protein